MERFLHQGKPTHWWGNQLGWKGSIWSYWKGMNQLICDRQKRVRPTDGLCQNPVHPRLLGVFASSQWGLKAGTWGLDTKLRSKMLLTVRRQPEGMEGRKFTTRNACQRNPELPQKQGTTVEWHHMQGTEPPLQPHSPYMIAPDPPGTSKSSHHV